MKSYASRFSSPCTSIVEPSLICDATWSASALKWGTWIPLLRRSLWMILVKWINQKYKRFLSIKYFARRSRRSMPRSRKIRSVLIIRTSRMNSFSPSCKVNLIWSIALLNLSSSINYIPIKSMKSFSTIAPFGEHHSPQLSRKNKLLLRDSLKFYHSINPNRV